MSREAPQAIPAARWGPALVMTFARLVLAYGAHGLTALVLALAGTLHPWQAAAPWWTVSGSLIDLACLGLLTFFVHREGGHLGELVGFERSRLPRDLALGLGLVLVFVFAAAAGGIGASLLVYGVANHTPPMGGLPLWGMLYSLACWPLLWGFTEQLTYNGFALPRLVALSRSRALAVFLVCLGWAGQHIALPALFDARFMAYRFLSSLPVAVIATLFFLRTRRLVPLVVAHVLVDLLAPASVLFGHASP